MIAPGSCPGRTGAEHVATIPRGIGASNGVKDTRTAEGSSPPAAAMDCSISGVC